MSGYGSSSAWLDASQMNVAAAAAAAAVDSRGRQFDDCLRPPPPPAAFTSCRPQPPHHLQGLHCDVKQLQQQQQQPAAVYAASSGVSHVLADMMYADDRSYPLMYASYPPVYPCRPRDCNTPPPPPPPVHGRLGDGCLGDGRLDDGRLGDGVTSDVQQDYCSDDETADSDVQLQVDNNHDNAAAAAGQLPRTRHARRAASCTTSPSLDT